MEIRKTDGLLKLGSETSKNNPVKDSSECEGTKDTLEYHHLRRDTSYHKEGLQEIMSLGYEFD